MMTVVEQWLGYGFAELHPMLQDLHRTGGELSGPVEVAFGQGLAGFLGRRIAAKLGVPVVAGTHRLKVVIRSQDGILHWGRTFNDDSGFNSEFIPFGCYPQGHWVESSGPLRLVLGVSVQDGGWHWQHRSTRLHGIPIPRFLLPTTIASKHAEGEFYRFAVEVRASVFGKLLEYSGSLAFSPFGEANLTGVSHTELTR